MGKKKEYENLSEYFCNLITAGSRANGYEIAEEAQKAAYQMPGHKKKDQERTRIMEELPDKHLEGLLCDLISNYEVAAFQQGVKMALQIALLVDTKYIQPTKKSSIKEDTAISALYEIYRARNVDYLCQTKAYQQMEARQEKLEDKIRDALGDDFLEDYRNVTNARMDLFEEDTYCNAFNTAMQLAKHDI